MSGIEVEEGEYMKVGDEVMLRGLDRNDKTMPLWSAGWQVIGEVGPLTLRIGKMGETKVVNRDLLKRTKKPQNMEMYEVYFDYRDGAPEVGNDESETKPQNEPEAPEDIDEPPEELEVANEPASPADTNEAPELQEGPMEVERHEMELRPRQIPYNLRPRDGIRPAVKYC
eukprot:Platyproteum_vivax@DN13360_c0_g1_i1.p1